MQPPPIRLRAAIAIPAQDEVAQLPACLAALAAQRGIAFGEIAVVVLANNCTDATAALARALAPALPFQLLVREVVLPAASAHAGGARRAAMDAAAKLLPPRAALLSTDADGRAEPGWLAANLAALAAGADAVAGTIEPDPLEAALLPACLRAREAREAEYALLLDEMAALIDPDPHDPWPRHAVHSGASIALNLMAYRRVGGLPEVPVGEDRALFQALIRSGMRVRHCPAARVVVSCRLQGRAVGGMADTMRRRLEDAVNAPVDAGLEPARLALRRLRCRHRLRRLRAGMPEAGDPWRLARSLGVPLAELRALLRVPRFWQAWDDLQQHAAPLQPQQIALAALEAEISCARRVLRALRFSQPAAGPADNYLSVAAE